MTSTEILRRIRDTFPDTTAYTETRPASMLHAILDEEGPEALIQAVLDAAARPPQPATEKVPWHEAVGRRAPDGDKLVHAETSTALRPTVTDESAGHWPADDDGMVEVLVEDQPDTPTIQISGPNLEFSDGEFKVSSPTSENRWTAQDRVVALNDVDCVWCYGADSRFRAALIARLLNVWESRQDTDDGLRQAARAAAARLLKDAMELHHSGHYNAADDARSTAGALRSALGGDDG
jgi:hypothetical protein